MSSEQKKQDGEGEGDIRTPPFPVFQMVDMPTTSPLPGSPIASRFKNALALVRKEQRLAQDALFVREAFLKYQQEIHRIGNA